MIQDEGGRHVVKRRSGPQVVKVQVRDLVQVVGMFAPFSPRGFSIRGKFVLWSPSGYLCTVDLCYVPGAAVYHGRANQSSGMGLCGYCRGVLWVPDPAGQYSGKIRVSENAAVQDEGGGRHVFKSSSDTGEPTPRSKFRYGSLCELWVFLPPLPRGGSVLGKICYIVSQQVSGHRRPVQGAPSSSTSRESQAKFRDGTMWVL